MEVRTYISKKIKIEKKNLSTQTNIEDRKFDSKPRVHDKETIY
jgi:hypothetical protein